MSLYFPIPTLAQVRAQNRDYIASRIGQPLIGNDVPRILADANAALAHLNFQYLEWLSNQLLPDTAGTIFLDKWANIYLVNSDGSTGRKSATYATGTATVTAQIPGTVLPSGTSFLALNGNNEIYFETTELVSVSTSPTTFTIRSLTAGVDSNLPQGTGLRFASAINGINAASAVVVSLTGGADEETDDELRARILARIQKPPMSGDATDYEQWALACPGVTRAWCSPNEMGPGSVTIRIMCDDIRATTNPTTSGLPTSSDIAAVTAYIDSVRPVTVKDFFVLAPQPQPVNFTISSLNRNNPATRAAIASSVENMIFLRARPAQAVNGISQPPATIYAAWVNSAILGATGVQSFDLIMSDYTPSNNANIAVIGTITYD